jgi:acyl-CoA thioesterase
MTNKEKAGKIVDLMWNHDKFSDWLGIERVCLDAGYCELRMTVRNEMLNGFLIAHGGITYSLSDTALAFASNAHGKKCVSVETSISHVRPVREGDVLTAVVNEVSLTEKIGVYQVEVRNQNGEAVSFFKGTVYRTNGEWSLE